MPELTRHAQYEQQIPKARRIAQGRFYTPTWLCDFMLALAHRPTDGRILEPSCGAGVFLEQAYHRMQQGYAWPPERSAACLWGMDQDADAVAWARTRMEGHVPDFPWCRQIQVQDFLQPDVGGLEPFDLIIGNPPYVRQEVHAQSDSQAKADIRDALRRSYAGYLERYPEQAALFSGTADLYVWFFLQALRLLKPGGRLAFVVSNSWLNTQYGTAFRRFVLDHFQVLCLVESACERWFTEAAVNAVVVVLEKKSEPLTDEPQPTRLIRLHRPLVRWLPDSDSPAYWLHLDRQIQELGRLGDPAASVQRHTLSIQGDRPLSENWTMGLRCPKVIQPLLAADTGWTTLGALGQVRYPLKTGINRFFYLSRAEARRRGIESDFLHPVVKSLKMVQRYRITAEDGDTRLFSCPLDKAELARRGMSGALAYVTWGETQTAPPRQKRTAPVPWPQVPSVRANKPWHAIRPLPPAHILCSRFLDQRFCFPLCEGVMEDQTFYGLTLSDPQRHPPRLVAALLNSTLSFWLLEFNARTGLGEGVLQYARCDMARFPLPSPALYTDAQRQAILTAFEALLERPLLTVEQELKQPDRLALDRAVLGPFLQAIGLNQPVDELIADLAQTLTARMQERRTMALSARSKPGA